MSIIVDIPTGELGPSVGTAANERIMPTAHHKKVILQTNWIFSCRRLQCRPVPKISDTTVTTSARETTWATSAHHTAIVAQRCEGYIAQQTEYSRGWVPQQRDYRIPWVTTNSCITGSRVTPGVLYKGPRCATGYQDWGTSVATGYQCHQSHHTRCTLNHHKHTRCHINHLLSSESRGFRGDE